MQDAELHVLPGPPQAGLKRQILDELMRNPFLDDDLQMLSVRLGTPRRELSEALAGLSTAQFVRSTGRNSYMLDTEIGSELDGETATDELLWDVPAEADLHALQSDDAVPDHSNFSDNLGIVAEVDGDSEALVFLPHTESEATRKLVEALPIGIVVLNQDGMLELANHKASEWLGLPLDVLDGATFEIVTGMNPMSVLSFSESDGSPVIFSMKEPYPVEVTIKPCLIESGAAVLLVVRDTTLQEEVSKNQANLQEELFDQMRDEIVDPLLTIEQFLDRPDGSTLVQARAAMEQVNWFMRQFFLRDEPKK